MKADRLGKILLSRTARMILLLVISVACVSKEKFKMKNRIRFMVLFVCLLPIAVHAQTTEFTYQGRLIDGTNPANGQYDFQFKLFDTATAGMQQGSTQTITGVQVTNGIFTVVLNFGSTAFSAGSDRWLEISVKKPTDTSYSVLSPRQKITSAPYSLRSLLADTANSATIATNAINATTANNSLNLGGQPASAYVLTSDTMTFIRNQTTQQASSNFNISGMGKQTRLMPRHNTTSVGVGCWELVDRLICLQV